MASVTVRVPPDGLAAYPAIIPDVDRAEDEILREGYETIGQTSY